MTTIGRKSEDVAWYALSAEDTTRRLSVVPAQGLRPDQVSRLRAKLLQVDLKPALLAALRLRLLRHPASRLEKTEVALLQPFHLIRRWRTRQDTLSLYRRVQAGRR